MQKFETAGNLVLMRGERRRGAAAATDAPDRAEQLRALVEAVRRGDCDAFAQLYQLYAPMVHGILLARVPHKDVDDLVQDVFIAVHMKIHSLREPAAFGGWLATLTRNLTHDFHRQSRETEELPDDLTARSHVRSGDAWEIMAIIRTLPDAYSETLTLRLVEGMTGPEIAALTGLTPASVRVNLSRGMKILRKRLDPEKKS